MGEEIEDHQKVGSVSCSLMRGWIVRSNLAGFALAKGRREQFEAERKDGRMEARKERERSRWSMGGWRDKEAETQEEKR
ncbi:hypothetical protein IE53DRAFT_167970 [Violaceomyces palustris]|uniref:Uncharacterized protein n=1 Tax=Violaceomyces palustris TaxID=1673888 RepID=A0ACD0NT32_9BASI|nr:hypothetical protein IE53DRAFT_167970 [Violaceomyces palustris]